MAKKKHRKETAIRINEFEKGFVEPLDYERLAECIAKAIAEENGKHTNAYSVTREWMKYIISPVFWLISAITLFLCVGCFTYGISMLKTGSFTDVLKAFVSFGFGLIFISVAIPTFLAGKEFGKETDKQFVVSVFSGMVSLVALIISFVVLVMGVK